MTGPYGEGYDAVCHRLHQWAAPRGLEGGEWIFIYHDNPEVTPPAQCRTDIGISVPVGTLGAGRWKFSTSPPDATPSPATSSRIAASTGSAGRSTSAISSRPGSPLGTALLRALSQREQ